MQVTAIKTRKGKTLIEWIDSNGVPQRSFVPADKVSEDNTVNHPERGIPFGVNFAHFVKGVEIDPVAIDRELKLAGLWSATDVRDNPGLALAAVNRALGLVFQTLLANLKEPARKEAEQASAAGEDEASNNATGSAQPSA